MQVMELLKATSENDESYFRRALAKEDLARFERLTALAASSADFDAFRKAALYIGWTKDDMRTHDLRGSLDRLLAIFYRLGTAPATPGDDAALAAAWTEFHEDRLRKLIHCL
jgi:hypothetical protein